MMNDEDQRPVIGKCEWCECDIHGEDSTHYADTYYDIEGTLVCENCIRVFVDRMYRK